MKKKLSAQYLNSNLDAGRYYDDNGTGLNIHVRKSGSKNWSQRLRINGKQIELDLQKYVECPDCNGTGCNPGTSKSTCKDCNGIGNVNVVNIDKIIIDKNKSIENK